MSIASKLRSLDLFVPPVRSGSMHFDVLTNTDTPTEGSFHVDVLTHTDTPRSGSMHIDVLVSGAT